MLAALPVIPRGNLGSTIRFKIPLSPMFKKRRKKGELGENFVSSEFYFKIVNLGTIDAKYRLI